jgi:hypothetical protein
LSSTCGVISMTMSSREAMQLAGPRQEPIHGNP